MKKYFIYSLALLSAVTYSSCTDKDDVSDEVNREFMTMFRMDDNTGKGSDDPYRCQIVNMNDAHLYWYGVNGCAGYEIKMALQPTVSSGLASDWENPSNILVDSIVGPEQLDMVIKDLNYSTDYRFAIRTLSTKGEAYNSKWYGYGNGHQWAEYCGLTTENRYPVPLVIEQSEITKSSFRVLINRSYADSGDDADNNFKEHFEVDANGNYVMQLLTVAASATNPDAKVPDQFKKYNLTDEDFARGYVDITGLDENSVYIVNVQNTNIPIYVDAIYNSLAPRTDGEVGEPILIEHKALDKDTLSDGTTLVDISKYDACPLDQTLINYTKDNTLAEGTIFELEGGKTYYFKSNPSLCKGMTLRTRTSDVEKGLHAKVCLGGLWKEGTSVRSCNFMFGRQPVSGENSDVPIYIKSLIFQDIDFDCPLAECFNGAAIGTGNYFINMYSNGMPVTLQAFEVHDCTFQNMIRGFIRVQGTKRKLFEKVLVDGCEFYNDGYYDNNGRGYAWVAGDGAQPKSNIFQNMIFRNNTFYDSPRTCLFTDNGKNLSWPATVKYNITLENNTFVNFSTRSSGRNLFDLRYIPAGSTITVKKNLFILTKQDADTRNMYMSGMDIRQINGDPAVMTFDIADNWSTNTNLTAGQIFSAGAFSATKNSAGKYLDMWPNGKDELEVHVSDISPTDLMVNPNPPHMEQDDATLRHHVDNLNGIYFKNTDKVKSSEIYTRSIGAAKWRENLK